MGMIFVVSIIAVVLLLGDDPVMVLFYPAKRVLATSFQMMERGRVSPSLNLRATSEAIAPKLERALSSDLVGLVRRGLSSRM